MTNKAAEKVNEGEKTEQVLRIKKTSDREGLGLEAERAGRSAAPWVCPHPPASISTRKEGREPFFRALSHPF
ncbi:hypothetical protein AB0M86_45140 [Streptomyces sp. NPDC051639]|uniref:hypothetical protein n=1 Tax=Streptomyces sp. NPDC051639 TaxID=3155671 RepID=UPI003424FF04